MSTLEQILHHKIIAILRGVPPQNTLQVARALYAGGIRLLEITLNSDDAFMQIQKLSLEMGDKMFIGAGTVLGVQNANKAISAGAKFLISPNVDVDVIKCTKNHCLVSIPGAYTATEVCLAHKSGGDIIKIFPIPGPDYLKGLLAPLNHIRMMPTGGVNLSNIKQFKEAGAVAFGIGSSLVNNTAVMDDAYLDSLTATARSFAETAGDN